MHKIAIFCLGTWSVSQKKSNHFFGKAAHYLMHDERDFIWQLYNYCLEENKLILEGAGTDIVGGTTWSVGTLFKSLAGGIDGHIGEYGIRRNLEKIKLFIRNQAKAFSEDGQIEIHAFGWSRGACTILLLKAVITELIKEGIKIKSLHLTGLDPVLGGPSDRLRNIFNLFFTHQDPEVDISVDTYYSHTGNLNVWDWASEFLHQKYHINLPFFSAILDNTKNKKVACKNGKAYEYRSKKYIVPANHEGVNGRWRNEYEAFTSHVVLAMILKKSHLNYKMDWKKEMIESGQISLEKLMKKNIGLKKDRKYLDYDNLITSLVGRGITEQDEMMSLFNAALSDLIPGVYTDENSPYFKKVHLTLGC